LEDGHEVRFETAEEAERVVTRTPMYRSDPGKAGRKYRVVRTKGEIVFSVPLRSWKRLFRNEDTYCHWFEIMFFDDERSFDAPFQEILVEIGKPARYATFKDAFTTLIELMRVWGISDELKGHYNIVWFQSELVAIAAVAG